MSDQKEASSNKERDESLLLETARQKLGENLAIEGTTKRAATRLALLDVIKDGLVLPGELMPSELRLAEGLGVSLGTVQTALRQIQERGLVRRRRGDGTRVVKGRNVVETVWHGRVYLRSTGQQIIIHDEDLEKSVVSDRGPWSEFLPDAKEFVRIRRLAITEPAISASAEVFVDNAMFGSLLSMSEADLKMSNFRILLEQRFGITITRAENYVSCIRPDAETATRLALDADKEYLEVLARSFLSDGSAVSFQRIYVEAERCSLKFDAFNPGD